MVPEDEEEEDASSEDEKTDGGGEKGGIVAGTEGKTGRERKRRLKDAPLV